MSQLLNNDMGMKLYPAVISKADQHFLKDYFATLRGNKSAGKRLSIEDVDLIKPALIGADTIARSLLNDSARLVRAIIFNKSEERNWAVPWHQDRVIAVKKKHPLDGYTVWSVKDGIHHVEPPISILEKMVTLRLHLDNCGIDNAPLTIAKGSHKLGKIAEQSVEAVVRESEVCDCLASAGDVWAYSSTILHCSSSSEKTSSRLVLHLDYAAEELPEGLEWYF